MASNVNSNTMVTLLDTTIQSGTVRLPLTTDIPFRCIMFKDSTGATNQYSTVTINTSNADLFENGTNSLVLSNTRFCISLYANTYTNTWVILNRYGNTLTQGQNIPLTFGNSWYNSSFSQVLNVPLSNYTLFNNLNNFKYFKGTFTLSGGVSLVDYCYAFGVTFSNISLGTEVGGVHFNFPKFNFTYSNPFNPTELDISYNDFYDLSSFRNGDIYIPQLYMMGYTSGGDGNYFTDGSIDFTLEPVVNFNA